MEKGKIVREIKMKMGNEQTVFESAAGRELPNDALQYGALWTCRQTCDKRQKYQSLVNNCITVLSLFLLDESSKYSILCQLQSSKGL